jgi:uncharacterized OB-fold protein
VNGHPVGPATDWTRGGKRIVLAVCDECSNTWYLPTEYCPRCRARGRTPREAAGTGTCIAVTWVHVTAEAGADPVGLVLVELDEGPVVMGRTYDEALRPGDAAGVEFRRSGRTLLPSFSRKG